MLNPQLPASPGEFPDGPAASPSTPQLGLRQGVFRIGDTINAVIPVDVLEEYGLHWVKTERDARYPRARRLTAEEQGPMTPFFSPAALAVTRIQHIPTIPNPAFYDALPRMGLSIPLDFSQMWGLSARQ